MAKRLALLATGGTIACTPGAHGLTPTLTAADLLKPVEDSLPCEVVPQDVFLMDSSNMQPEEWSTLARAVDEALRDCDGVVITHGTDTMAYTASALSFMLAGVPKPVILTGSQLPLLHPLTDARGNLRHALAAATQPVGGVYVCFDYRLISGARCVKTHTTAMDAFSSINAPQAGFFDVEGVHVNHPQGFTPADGMGAEYRLREQLDARVFLLKLVPGTSPDVFRFVREAGYRGLVIEAFGLGGLHYIRRNLVEALRELAESGVYVLVVSQCLYEKADLTVYEVGRGMMREQVHSGRDMTTEAAVTKLMWALAQSDPTALLRNSLVGEMTQA
ncbi:MAG: asparaginase [Candidatus Limiplasma sp.]|nr:asparaginase [Candidatus Limiplasma sp.]